MCESRRRIQVNLRSVVESKIIDIETEELGCSRDKSNRNLFTGWAVSGVEEARA